MKHNIEKLIKLANIDIKGQELEKFKDSIDDILDWCEELNQVNTQNIEPMFSVFDVRNQGLQNLREDKVEDGNYVDLILKNSPDKEDVFICVPKVIE